MWLDSDTEAALAWQDEQGTICPGGCGLPLDETTATGASYYSEAVVCEACRARESAAHAFSEDGGGRGVLWTVRKSPDL